MGGGASLLPAPPPLVRGGTVGLERERERMTRSEQVSWLPGVPQGDDRVVEFAIRLSVSPNGVHRAEILRRTKSQGISYGERRIVGRGWNPDELSDVIAEFESELRSYLYISEGCQLSL